MIQKSTLIWMCLAAAAGTALFHTSESVHQITTQLEEAQRKIRQEQENLRVLEAEWSYLNQPERLEKLAEQLPELQPAQSRQILAASDVPKPGDAPPAAPKPEITPVSAQVKAQTIIREESAHKTPATPSPEKSPPRSFSAVLAGLGVND